MSDATGRSIGHFPSSEHQAAEDAYHASVFQRSCFYKGRESFSQRQVAPLIEQLQAKIAELEDKLKVLEAKGQQR